jgi:hypothetical protein
MGKNSGLILSLALLLGACSIETTKKVKIEMPSVPEIRLGQVQAMIVTNFWQDKEVKEFGLNESLVRYFQDELKRAFKGTLSTKTIAWDNPDLPKNKDFWKQAAEGAQNTLFLTGKVELSQELRKALLANEKRAIDDGPFAKESAWAERRNFSLKLELFLIQSNTGDILFQKEYLEQMNYPNIKQTAEFAFFDLVQRIKTKLFRALFETDRIQERYLLSK